MADVASISMVFPGQGSQSLGMLSELSKSYPSLLETFTEGSDVLGIDLWKLAQEGPRERLDETNLTQPLLLTAGVAVWRVWCEEIGILPRVMSGHSLGEYTAWVCAGALDFTDGVYLVAKRGELMQAACPKGIGAMAAILGLSDEEVGKACSQVTSGVVVPANFNAPGQVVIAGTAAAVQDAILNAKELGAKRGVLLPVSVAAHSPLMQSAAEEFAQILYDTPWQPPDIPVINNVDVAILSDPMDIKNALLRQLTGPVRWVEVVRKMANMNIITECGPGQVLTGLGTRCVDVPHIALSQPEGFAKAKIALGMATE